jgi:hypothetical protein
VNLMPANWTIGRLDDGESRCFYAFNVQTGERLDDWISYDLAYDQLIKYVWRTMTRTPNDQIH